MSDIDIGKLVESHKASGSWCTLTAVTQPGRYGALRLDEKSRQVLAFREKGAADGGLINGGFFVCEPEVLDLIDDDYTTWENEPMERLVEMEKLGYYHHQGYWQSMDSLRDRMVLETAWAETPPWKVWKD